MIGLPRRFASGWKQSLKAQRSKWHAAWVQTFRSFGRDELLDALRALGIQPGDCVMLHSAFSRAHGFRGSIPELIDSFLEVVGDEGHLMMVSLPYRTSSLDWLESGRLFDVRTTPSMMGMVSEVFRRRADVLRSLHPTHPVLVRGPQAQRFVDAHAQCLYPCGPGTPFDELARSDGKVVFLNVPIDTFTFFHYLEHRVSPALPFSLYTERPYDAAVVDADGQPRSVRTYAFAREAIRRRRPERLYQALFDAGHVRSVRVGATRLLALRVADAIACTDRLQAEGRLFYDLTP